MVPPGPAQVAAQPSNGPSSREHICLEVDDVARNKAVARLPIRPGAVVLSDTALATALLPKEKSRRCDYCHHVPTSDKRLQKCSGCAAFWYCGIHCQKKQWKAHHKRLCKHLNIFTASPEYQALDPREQTDALLLSYVVAQVHTDKLAKPGNTDAIEVFFDLLKGPYARSGTFLFCGDKDSGTTEAARDAYSRFGNNNFVVHSHLTSYAHGVFPVASRLFNHSCYPNCVVKFAIAPQNAVEMKVVAIRDIGEGEEITIPYLDPALPLDTRTDALRMNYGFTCGCELCSFQRQLGSIKPLPADASLVHALEDKLRAHVAARPPNTDSHGPSSPSNATPWVDLPADLYPLFNEAYLPQLSETFSRTSHEGEYEAALSSGRTLSAYYAVVYPPNYPQIGMHALEIAKTAWNCVVSRDDASTATQLPSSMTRGVLEDMAGEYLDLARRVLECFGPEGDEGGPMVEIQFMRELLHR